MLVLWLIITVFVGVACAIVVLPLYKKQTIKNIDRKKLNVQIYQERLRALEQTLAAQQIDQATFDERQQQMAQNLLHDVDALENNASSKASNAKRGLVAVLACVFIIGFSLLLYLQWGSSAALKQWYQSESIAQSLPENLEELGTPEEIAAKLKAVVENNPDDAQGWYLLGRLYLGLQRFTEAEAAFANADRLEPSNPTIKLQYAQSLYFANQNRLNAKAQQLVQQVLALQPNNPVAENLLALDAFSRGDYQQAIDIWRKVVVTLPANSDDAKAIMDAIARAQSLMAEQAQPVDAPSVLLKVSLAATLKDKVRPNDTLFVFARAVNGPPMPLAVIKKSASALPLEVTLSDKDAMLAQAKLSNFKAIDIVARISQSGQVKAQPGDLQGSVRLQDWQQQTQALPIVIDDIITTTD